MNYQYSDPSSMSHDQLLSALMGLWQLSFDEYGNLVSVPSPQTLARSIITDCIVREFGERKGIRFSSAFDFRPSRVKVVASTMYVESVAVVPSWYASDFHHYEGCLAMLLSAVKAASGDVSTASSLVDCYKALGRRDSEFLAVRAIKVLLAAMKLRASEAAVSSILHETATVNVKISSSVLPGQSHRSILWEVIPNESVSLATH